MDPIRVLQVSPFAGEMSGADRALLVHTTELARRGPALLFAIAERSLTREARRAGAQVTTAFPGEDLPASRHLRFAVIVAALVRAIRRLDIQLIHSHSAIGNHYCVPAAILTNRPLITHQRDTWRPDYFHFGLGAARRIIAVSHWAKRSLPARMRHRTVVAYDPVEIPDNPQRSEPASLRLGMAGSAYHGKGQDLLVGAALQLASRHDFTVHIWGLPPAGEPGGAYADSVRQMVAAAPPAVQARFDLQPFRRDMENFYSNVDIVVAPSRVAEGFGLMMAEGMARQKVVIAAKVGAMAEFIRHGENGFHFMPGDATDLAIQLERVFLDPSLRARVRLRGYQTVSEHCRPDRYMDVVESVYRGVLGRRKDHANSFAGTA